MSNYGRQLVPECGKADQFGFDRFVQECRTRILQNELPSSKMGFRTCSSTGFWEILFDRRVPTWGNVQIWAPGQCCSGCYGFQKKAAMLVHAAVRNNIIEPPRRPGSSSMTYEHERRIRTPAPAPAPAYAYAPEPERITAQAVSGSSVAPAASAASAHQEPPQKRSEFEGIDTRDFPNEYRCPITMEPMEDPVVCMDGNTYERSAIEEWLERSNKSPMTNVPLPSSMLVPNRVLKCLIREHAERVRKEQSSKLSDESKS